MTNRLQKIVSSPSSTAVYSKASHVDKPLKYGHLRHVTACLNGPMKRWQDLGEVPDSDDDGEDSLDLSPPKKRVALQVEAGGESPNILTQNVETSGSPSSFKSINFESQKAAVDIGIQPTNNPHGSNREKLKLDSNETGLTSCTSSPLTERDQTPEEPVFHFPRLEDIFGRGQIVSIGGSSDHALESVSGRLDYESTEATLLQPSGVGGWASSPMLEDSGEEMRPTLSNNARANQVLSSQSRHHRAVAKAIQQASNKRNLRTRKDIQLHPFMIESAKHNLEFRSAGLRPVRLENMEQKQKPLRENSSDAEPDSSQAFHHSNSNSNSLQTRDIASQCSDVGVVNTAYHLRSTEDNSIFDFPNGEAAVNGRVQDNAQLGNKRRKTQHRPIEPRSSSQTTSTQNSSHQGFGHSSKPLSPLQTSRDSAKARNLSSKFRLPDVYTATHDALPTPQISSSVRQSDFDTLYTASDDSDGPRAFSRSRTSPKARRVLTTSLSSSSSGAESEVDSAIDERRLQRERRRIRGVLPASWLKIDFKAQRVQGLPTPTRMRDFSNYSPPPTIPQKGVAQVVPRRAGVLNTSQLQQFSNDEDCDANSPDRSPVQGMMAPQQTTLQFRPTSSSVPVVDLLDEDEMESDWIDPMISAPRNPLRTRNRTRQHKTKARKNVSGRIGDLTNLSVGGLSDNRPGPSRRDRRLHTRTRDLVQLSVLDAPALSAGQQGSTPQFIRLAERALRERDDLGRCSPSGKLIRLATASDSRDALDTLKNWQKGTIPQRYVPPKSKVRSPPTSLVRHRLQPTLKQLSATASQQRLPQPSPTSLETSARLKPPLTRRNRLRLKQALLQLPKLSPYRDEPPAMNGDSANQSTSEGIQERLTFAPKAGAWIRDAQLEALESQYDRIHRIAAQEHRMQRFGNSNFGNIQPPPANAFTVERYWNDEQTTPDQSTTCMDGNGGGLVQKSTKALRRPIRQRKRRAQKLHIDAQHYRQSSVEMQEAESRSSLVETHQQDERVHIRGLGSYGTEYPTDFGINPLPLGTYWHRNTFIGSGELADALCLAAKDLDGPTSARLMIRIGDESVTWAEWNEDVSYGFSITPTAFQQIFSECQGTVDAPPTNELISLLEQNVNYLLRSIIRYISKCLAFLDAVDRQACIVSILSLIDDLTDLLQRAEKVPEQLRNLRLYSFKYLLILAKQAAILGDHPAVQSGTRVRARESFQKRAIALARELVEHHLNALRASYENNRISTKRESGLCDKDASFGAVVVLHQAMLDRKHGSGDFWATISRSWPDDLGGLSSVGDIDNVWHGIMILLPALEVNSDGVVALGSRLEGNYGDWDMPKQLIQVVLGLYESSINVKGGTINGYVRACLARCHILITRWGWYKCETLLFSVFDFFGRRGLGLLHKEESRGSPAFLDNLACQPSLEIEPGNSSFALFLKLIVLGLQGMRKKQNYSERKIGSIVWRLIPNHGRTYPKEAEVRQDDLDALHNHHDLLCSLYYAAPPARRPPMNLLRNLVDHRTSHREACRISVKAWARLTIFQSASNESMSPLDPLLDWFQDILRTTVLQYRLARNEADEHFAAAKAQGVHGITESLLESTVASNQRRIVATIVDCLTSLKRALQAASSFAVVAHLVERSYFWLAFDVFDPNERRTHGLVLEGLNIVKATLSAYCTSLCRDGTQTFSEESQDYGDVSGFEDLIFEDHAKNDYAPDIIEKLIERVWRLLSDVFGTDLDTEDTLLVQLVDVWVALAQIQVEKGNTTWESYVNSYSTTSWTQLRNTVRTRKMLPYFLACICERAYSDLTELRPYLLTSWLRSLVEREAKLKYQHVFTTSLLQHYGEDLMLANLPVAQDEQGKYAISLLELRQRRLALLSSILSNMRDVIDDGMEERRSDLQAVRKFYHDLLREVMQAMKANYQDLQTSSNSAVASATAQGVYVDFVQQVITFLQQYTSEICAVDRFFTDSTAFPLPITDPTYVVGRLRSYAPKLTDPRARKQLVVFVQTVCERAAVDQEQDYLIEQLQTAITGDSYPAELQATTLRQVLLTSIFPVYLELSITNPCAWIIAGPIVQACRGIFKTLIPSTDFQDERSLQVTKEIIIANLQAATRPLHTLAENPSLCNRPNISRVGTAIFEATTELFTPIEYLLRTASRNSDCLDSILACTICHIHMLGEHLQRHLLHGDHEDFSCARPLSITMREFGYQDTLQFTREQARLSLERDWLVQEGRHFFMRRGTNNDRGPAREVYIDLQDELVEQDRILQTLQRFRLAYKAIFDLKRGEVEGKGEMQLMKDLMV